MATTRTPSKKRTARSPKKGKGGSFWKRIQKFWKQNKELITGIGKLLVVALLVVAVSIPFLRGSNPGNTYGIDVSSHNGKIDWDDVAENGMAFAVIRAGGRSYKSGELYKDEQFKRNMRSAWFHHVDRGVYFYSQAVNADEAKEEAEYTLKEIGGANLALPVFIDVEDTGTDGKGRADGLTKDERTAVVLAFAEVVSEKGYTPGVYANRWFLQNYLDTSALEKAGVQIWLAEYTKKSRPQYTGHYDYWQYTDSGKVSGITGTVDLNRNAE